MNQPLGKSFETENVHTEYNHRIIILISCVATIGGFLFGFDSGVINGTLDGLQTAFQSDSMGTGFNVASILVGCAVGAFFAGHLADLYGRRALLLVAAVFAIFLLAFAGIPLTSGFAGKFAVFKAAAEGGAVPLVGGLAMFVGFALALLTLDQPIGPLRALLAGAALLVITVLLLFLFGSVKIGAVAIFPNLFPILTAFGVMGLLALPLDADTLLVAPIIIGIAVDDTIHFLIHYRAGMRRCRAMSVAVRDSMREAGQAICFTTLTLALGYLTFLLSSHSGMRHFGAVSATAVVAALLADLLLLPALCRLCRADFAGQFARDRVPSAERIFKDNPCSTFTLSGRN
ncbi:MAG: MFS transporter [Exilibacterium sp.]